jgi:ribosome maturation protein Sdo1
VAKQEDLKLFKPIKEKKQIIFEILNRGELQIQDMKREDQTALLTKEVATIICQKCFNSEDKSLFSEEVILQAMVETKSRIKVKAPAKKQALRIITILKAVLPIQRSKLRVKILYENREQGEDMRKLIETELKINKFQIESLEDTCMVVVIEPHWFKDVLSLIEVYKHPELAEETRKERALDDRFKDLCDEWEDDSSQGDSQGEDDDDSEESELEEGEIRQPKAVKEVVVEEEGKEEESKGGAVEREVPEVSCEITDYFVFKTDENFSIVL